MRELLVAALALSVSVGCGRLSEDPAPRAAAPTARIAYRSHARYPALLAALKHAGGHRSRVLHPRTAGDLNALTTGRRYKFVVTGDGQMAVAPLSSDVPNNEYVHPILAGGAEVLSAGGLTITREGGRVTRVVVDPESHAYCTPTESLAAAEAALTAMGVERGVVEREARSYPCEASERPPGAPPLAM